VLDNARAGMEISWSVSGRAPNILAESPSEEARGAIRAVPGPIAKRQWIILAALALAFAVSSGMAVRRNPALRRTVSEGAEAPRPSSDTPTRDLTALKDELFALEVRRQRGEISEADYEAKRRALQHSLEAALRSDAEAPS
jgi:hypothetical protein